MHIRRGPLNWGVFLILTGAVPLAVRAGYLTDEQISRLWSLWPLILVGLGIGLVLSRTRLDFLGGLVVAATFGLMAGGVLSTGVTGLSTGACGPGDGDTAFPTRDGVLSSSAASIDLELDCGDATIVVAAGTGWRVEGEDGQGVGPDVTATADDLDVRSSDDDGGTFGPFAQRESWRVTLPDQPRLDVGLSVNAGSADVDLGTAAVDGVEVDLNAGSVTLDLGAARAVGGIDVGVNAGSFEVTLPNVSMTGSIQVNAGSVSLCAPPGAALRLRTGESIIASYDYAGQGLVQDGSTWTTPGFDTAAVKIDLRTEANVGSFTLNPEDGCE